MSRTKLRVNGSDFETTILVEPGEFEKVCFKVGEGTTIEISAWETAGDDFDLYLMREDDVQKDVIRMKHALKSWEHEDDLRDKHAFIHSGSVCLVISNIRAYSVHREVHLKLVLSKNKPKIKSSETPTGRTQRVTLDIKLLGALLIIAIPLVCGALSAIILGDLIVLTIAGIFEAIVIGVFNSELRHALGLEIR